MVAELTQLKFSKCSLAAEEAEAASPSEEWTMICSLSLVAVEPAEVEAEEEEWAEWEDSQEDSNLCQEASQEVHQELEEVEEATLFLVCSKCE